jgi:hypothetical protein
MPLRTAAANSLAVCQVWNDPLAWMSAKGRFHSNSAMRAIHLARKGRSARTRNEVWISERSW